MSWIEEFMAATAQPVPTGRETTPGRDADSDGDALFQCVTFTMRDPFDQHEMPRRCSVIVAASDLEEAYKRSGDIFLGIVDVDDPPDWVRRNTLSGEICAPGDAFLNWFAREDPAVGTDQSMNAERLEPVVTQEGITQQQPGDKRLRQQQFECVAFVFDAFDDVFDPNRSPIRRSCVLWAHDEKEAYDTSEEILTGDLGSGAILNWFVQPAVPA